MQISEDRPENNQVSVWQRHVGQLSTWQRGLFLLLFVVIYFFLRFIIAGIAFFQFVTLLITGEINQRLQLFSQGLCTYSYQVARYLTFTTEDKPFPFSHWPQD
ncbi:DUF4389 domain-containing protein [Thioflexithrix psekupsensis]|uniref:Lipase n=1 Tax=Thioflexithrix psekupsensis TaxID=1570016 RepID=A0A251XCM6_9GAMM|nr:DUF4389 domain-containing protein [Thioflexithrix psekupsensis]OUD12830.1 hypothetical protein TPSD3_12515 [Thioflexithrix psekupsensis]OUD16049.1 hypothetical protein TPSD3_01195 [Thioflexithrix psekupsensis]